MLSVHLIERHFRTRRFEPLLEALASNGLLLPLPLRVRLSQHPSCIVALALRRLTDLAYSPTPVSHDMTRFLLDEQDQDGSWHGDPLATAIVLVALTQAGGDAFAGPDVAVAMAAERAQAALAAMQDSAGLFFAADDRTEQDQALTAAYILALLNRDADFRAAVRYADLMNYFESRADRLEPDTHTLFHLAQLDEPAIASPNRALAAIAA